MRFTLLTGNCLLFLLNKTHNTTNHCSRHHVYHNSLFSRKHPFSSTATRGDDDRAVDRSSPSPSSSSPTISYLIRNCGLSTRSAISVSKKFKLKFPEKSDSVLRFLRDYGFSDARITALIIKYPPILAVQTDRNLKPKLEFLLGEGFTDLQVVDILSTNPCVLLSHSLERRIIPSITFIKTILPTNAAIFQFLKHSSNLITPVQLANTEILRSNGAPESIILKMFASCPRSMSRNPNSFAEAVEKTMDLGFEPSKPSFAHAVGVMSYIKKSTWERKVILYKSLGWSNDETLLVFKRQPLCFNLSDKLIKKKIDFFTKKLGYSPKCLVAYPELIRLSLEKRIIPRCSVLSVLIAKGLIKENTIFLNPLKISMAKFLVKFVEKHKDQVPEVVEAYNGKLGFEGLV